MKKTFTPSTPEKAVPFANSRRIVRRSLVCAALLEWGVACGPSEKHQPAPNAPYVFVTHANITISGSAPDEAPDVFVTLNVSDPAKTPTTLTADQLYLFESPDQEPVATLHGAFDPAQLDFENGEQESTYFLHIEELNRDLSAACSATDLELDLHSSACGCAIVAKHEVGVLCTPDARAGSVLDDPGLPAPANEPCAMREYLSTGAGTESLSEEHRYRYDAGGHLRFVDVFDATGAFTERRAYTHGSSGYLEKQDTISPDSRLVTSRKTYFYDSVGLLSEVRLDGTPSFDGVTDRTTTYSLTGQTWTETTTYADPSSGTRETSYTYDEANLTLTSDDGTVVRLGEPLLSPNQVFAMPGEVEIPKVLSSAGAPYHYDANGRLTSVEYPSLLGNTLRDDYSYACP